MIPALKMQRQEDQKLRVIRSYGVGSRPAFVTSDLFLT